MNRVQSILKLAKDVGFEEAGVLDPKTVELKTEVRDICADGTCRSYGHNWQCPPAVPELPECRRILNGFNEGILVETVGELEDPLDYESMMEAGKLHKKRLLELSKKIRDISPEALCLGAGGCDVCEKCRYPGPCIFPELSLASMEAFGMVVSEICKANQVPYYHGPDTITYVGCCLF